MQAGLAEIQKNIAMLTTLTEPLQIVDKRRKQIIATVYPRLVTHHAAKLAGKYRQRISATLLDTDFETARELSMRAVLREKYDLAD